MPAPTSAGVAALEEACKEVCALLEQLGQTFEGEKRRPITKDLLKCCYGLVFTHSVKAGALVGFSRGHGIVIKKLQDGQFSAPCFITMTMGKAGALVGFEKVDTIMFAQSPGLFDQLEIGVFPVLGVDISVQQPGQDAYEISTGGPSDRGAWGPDDRKSFGLGGSDLLAITVSKGVLVSLGNLQGGVTTVDLSLGSEVYGPGVSTGDILSGKIPRPVQLQPVYDKLAAILAVGKSGSMPA